MLKVMSTPRSVDLQITARCNLRCSYCSHFTSEGDVNEDLPTEEWLAFFEELNRCAVMSVCIQGGEPFVRNDIEELIHGIVRNRMRFSILSNGTLITDELADFLALTRRCDFVQLSIDGSVPSTHDVFRGKGGFDKVNSGLQILLRHQVPVTVRVTIHKKNLEDLEDIVELLLSHVGLPTLSTNSACYLGLCRSNSEQVQLTVEERSKAMYTLTRLASRYENRINATAGPMAEAQTWIEMETSRATAAPRSPGGGYLTSCNGPMSNLAVTANGMFVPCSQMPGMQLGRINKDDLREVWQHHPELWRFRNRSQISLATFEFCEGCQYVQYCRGGCPAISYSMYHDPYHPSPDSCYRRFLDAGGILPGSTLTLSGENYSVMH